MFTVKLFSDFFAKYIIPDSLKIQSQVKGNIVNIQRVGLQTLSGKEAAADPSAINCLVLEGTEGKRFGLKIVTKNTPHSLSLAIQTEKGPQTLYVDGQELYERLPFTKEQRKLATQAISKNKFEEFLTKSPLLPIMHNFTRLEERNNGSYTQSQLLDLISQMYDLHLNKKSLIIKKESQEIVGRFRGDKLSLYNCSAPKIFAEGSEAKIASIPRIPDGKDKVLKIYQRENSTKEPQLLTALHAGFKDATGKELVPGILKPFSATVEKRTIGTKFENDFWEAIYGKDRFFNTLPLIEKLEVFYPVLLGFHLCYTHKNLFHGDIKPENILYRHQKTDHKLELRLNDFGTAQLLMHEPDVPLGKLQFYTSSYAIKEEIERCRELAYTFEDLDQFAFRELTYHNYRDLGHKIDIFSLGRVFGAILAPYSSLVRQCPEGFCMPHTFEREKLEDEGIESDLCDLLAGMLEGDPTSRFNSQQVLTAFETILKARGQEAVITQYAQLKTPSKESIPTK